jgi:hypothetical protein
LTEKYQRQQTHAADQNRPPSQNRAASKATALQSLPEKNPTDEQHGNSEKNGGEFWSAKLTDWLLAAFTLALVIFTRRLYKATAGLFTETAGLREAAAEQSRDMKASIAAASRAADAANKSADIAERALTELETPFLSIKIIDTGITRSYGKMGHDFQIIRFCVVNYGRTPARLIELADRFALLDINAGLPPEANPQSATRNQMPYGVIAPPSGESQEFTNTVFGAMANALITDSLPLQTKAIFFYGFIRYLTIFNEVYRLGFCFIFDKFSEKWLLAGGETHNYCRKESRQAP